MLIYKNSSKIAGNPKIQKWYFITIAKSTNVGDQSEMDIMTNYFYSYNYVW